MKREPRYPGYLTDVPGFQLGNWQDERSATGVSVVLAPEHCTAGVDVRGAAPGTRETDLLQPENSVQYVNAITLSGGSAFGLAASSGVMQYLRAKNIGFDTGFGKVPIVCGCVLFDLSVGNANAFPTEEDGYQAAKRASYSNHEMGNVGCGCGASVGKLFSMPQAMKSGLGQASVSAGKVVVSCVVGVNALGDVVDPWKANQPIAGLCDQSGRRVSTIEAMRGGAVAQPGTNTTIAVVATNAKLDKAGCRKLAQMAHDGYAKAIQPVHTMADGDTIFALASGAVACDATLLGVMAVEAVSKAIVNAAITAENAYGLRATSES